MLLRASIRRCPPGLQRPSSEQPSQPHRQVADNSAFSALSSFAQQIGAEGPSRPAPRPPIASSTTKPIPSCAPLPSASAPASRNRSRTSRNWPSGQACWNFCVKEAPRRLRAPRRRKGPVAGGKQPSAPVEAHFVGAQGLLDLPREPGRGVRKDADGPHRQDSKRQVRLRELPRSGLGAREGRRRPRRRRDHLVPAERSIAHGAKRTTPFASAAMRRATALIGTAACTKRAA